MNRYSVMAAVAQQQVAVAVANVTYVGGYSAGQGANTTGIPMVLPTHAADDFAIVFARADQQSTTLSIGTATGWTQLRQDTKSPARPMTSAVFYKKLTSSSEVNPVVNISAAEEHSGSVMVFRGVDTTTPFDVTTQYATSDDAINPANPPITTASADCALVLLCGINQYHIDTAGKPVTPSGLVLGPVIVNPTIHCMQVTAYKLNVGAAGTYTPSVWTNAPASSVPDSQRYTIALRPSVVVVSNTTPASISGFGYTGQTLNASVGTWVGGTPTGQWYADDVAIAGQTSTSYVVTEAYNGADFHYRETVGAVIQDSNHIHHWIPTDLAATEFWIDRAANNYTAVANKVSQVNDLSGYARHAVQTTEVDKPLDNGTFGSVNAFSFVSNSEHLQVTGLPTTGTLNYFAVCRHNDAAVVSVSVFGDSDNTYMPIGLYGGSTSTNLIRVNGTNDPAGLTQLFNGQLTQTVTQRGQVYNSLIVNNIYAVRGSPAITASVTRIGNNNASYTLVGPLAESVIVSGTLTTDQYEKITGYLGHKNGITLAAGHTYETAPRTVQPSNTTPASISGFGYTGQTLTAIPGTWVDGVPTGQWYADDVAISGETGTSYVVTEAYNGADFHYRETVGAVIQDSNHIHHWTFADLPGATFYDASVSSTITEVSGAVSSFVPSIGTGITLAQSEASDQPSTGVVSQNGLNGFDFFNKRLGDGSVSGATRSASVMFIIKPNAVVTSTSATQAILTTDRYGSSSIVLGPASSAIAGETLTVLCDDTTSTGSRRATSTNISAVAHIVTLVHGSNTWHIGVDGSATMEDLSSSNAYTLQTDRPWWLGRNVDSFSSDFEGQFYCLMLRETALTTTEREKAEGYMAHKWGITLAAGHTYLSAPPDYPQNTTPASISGIGYTGQTLNASVGTWLGGTPTGQWYADNVAISGETGTSYVVTEAYNGADLHYRETVGAVIQDSNHIHHWIPLDMPSSEIGEYHDTAYPASITEVAGSVPQWSDSSVNARHKVNGTTLRQPTYTANAPTVDFNGLQHNLNATNAFAYNNGSADFYVVAAVPAGQSGIPIYMESNAANNNYEYSIGTMGGSNEMAMKIKNDDASLSLSNYTPLSSGSALDGTMKLYHYRDTGSSVSGRVNGGAAITENYTRGVLTVNVSCIAGAYTNNDNVSRECAMNLAMFITLTTLATDDNRKKLEGYAKHKHGITLDGDHTYFSSPPDAL